MKSVVLIIKEVVMKRTRQRSVASLATSAALPTSGVFMRGGCASERRDALKMIVSMRLL
jgi:hypothetical protein